MKKFLSLIAFVVLFSSIGISSAFALPTSPGTLRGMAPSSVSGTAVLNPNNLTDGDPATSTYIPAGNWVEFDLGQATDLLKYYSQVSVSTTNHFILYDANHGAIYEGNFASYYNNNQTTWVYDNLASALDNKNKNIRYIRLGAQNSPTEVYELDFITTLTSGPTVPAGLTATPNSASVTLNWTAVTGATSYNIKRSITAGGPYTTVATAITSTTYTNIGLTNGTKYYYVVTAVNTGGESGNSNEVSATPVSSGGGSGSSRAIVTIHLVGGAEKEYDLSAAELDNFLNWTDSATQSSRYKFVKNWNIAPFKARAEYIVYGKIVNFDVDELDPV
ncbi:fibronectin type III domain-containing protein [Cohnella sp. JJ-181]|uniref:fibronectin type III domain-containing protein n=1 Tax=Cohnella rhizoplanae TaxID=2974897 RepID=UPI0022FFC2AB|nr:fibronectin type III domain-containing protein [Cohnella sp. JJ-181]CAI6086722.1 hypothetical protein COHCIP112018_05145 [Cohnella sp. JJ-181]